MIIDLNIPEERFYEFRTNVAKIAKKFKVNGKIIAGEKILVERDDSDRERVIPAHFVIPSQIVIEDDAFLKFSETGAIFYGIIKKDLSTVLCPSEDCDIELNSLKEEIETMPCASCGKKHARKTLFVFADKKTGKVETYGSSCCKTKFGIDFEYIVSRFEHAVESIRNMADKMYTGFDGRLNIHDSRAFCAVTAMIIEKYGYVSKAKAMEWGTEATTCRVNENVDILENGPDGRRPYE